MDVEQDTNGADLATARLSEPLNPLAIAGPEPVGLGESVWTYGFPLTSKRESSPGNLKIIMQPRLLRGYVTRAVWYRDPKHGAERLCYELDMLSPEGLSGAPLFLEGSSAVVGVVYAAHDEYTIDEFRREDPQTGTIEPEVRRIVWFALAHTADTLRSVKGAATGGRPLGELLR